MNIKNKKIHQHAFTLIELVISMTIIAIAIIGVMLAINTAELYSGDTLIKQQAASIAEAYLEEILGKNFPSGACPSGTRSTWTNICNYNGLSQAPTDQDGNAIAALAAYTVTVNVDSSTAVLGGLTAGIQVVRVDVNVSHRNMSAMTYSVYATNYN